MLSITDAHTHVLLPPRVMDLVRELFEVHMGAGELAWQDTDPTAVLDSLAADGVERAWALPYAHRGGTSRRFNAHTAEAAAEHAGSGVELVVGCTTHPAEDDPAAIVADAVDDLGARVLKLHCSVGDYALDDERLDEALVAAAERRVPVVVHAGHAITGHTAGHELAPIDRVATRHPDLTIVVAHCGLPDVDGVFALLDTHDSVHADLTPVVFDPVLLHRTQVLAHADRLLFGSDAPNSGIRVDVLRANLEALDLPREVLSAVLSGNADRLVAN